MPTKIRRSLFVGLGGTGMKALLHTKKMFIDTYGEVPNMIGFLGVDTDGGEYNSELKSTDGQVVRLEPSEQMQILVKQNPQPIFHKNSARLSWFPTENLSSLAHMTIGAGQVRSNGRFAITFNENAVAQKLKNVVNAILNVQHSFSERYELMSSALEIHVVFSLCGGTGSGTFINMAYLLREAVPDAKVYGYAVLPGIFDAMINQPAAKAKVPSNAFGSLMDLDYLMHLTMADNPINIEYFTRTYTTTQNPFDAVYVIDNKNKNNDIYNDVADIAQMISLALVTSTGELSVAQQSVFDNVVKVVRDGNMDIEDKKAWAAGFGICEICYNGEELTRILKYKTVARIIELLENTTDDSNILANNWIDDNHIRENNGRDDVIDYVCSKIPKIPFTAINTPVNPQPEIDAYLASLAVEKPENVSAKIDKLKSTIGNALKAMLVEEVNKMGGIGNALNVIQDINAQIDICLAEMRAELEVFKNREPVVRSQKETTIAELVDYMGKFIKLKKQEYIDAVVETVNQYAVILRETDRRNAAISFYSWLKQELSNQENQLNGLKEKLNKIKKSCDETIAQIQYNINNNTNIFQIDLAKREVNKITYDDDKIVISDFVQGIAMQDKIYDFCSLQSDAVLSQLKAYADSICDKSKYNNASIDTILRGMDETELRNVLREAVVKSEPLIQYNSRGYVQPYEPETYFYVGVENKDTSVLVEDNFFANMFNDRKPDFTSMGNKNKIIIYCQYGNMPLFTIGPVPSFEHRYNEVMRNGNCHFGVDLLARMQRENFSIMPKDTSTDAVELWVKGLIFGLIKNDVDKFVYKCEAEGDIIDDYWVDLPQDRYEAFVEFKNHQNAIEKEYEAFFENLQREKGMEEINKIIQDAKANYEARYAQLKMDKSILKTRGYELVLKLYRQELEFVKKEL